MQFTNEVNWSLFDFILMGGLLFVFISLIFLIQLKVSTKKKKIAILFALLFFLYLWAELAVGIFDFPFSGN